NQFLKAKLSKACSMYKVLNLRNSAATCIKGNPNKWFEDRLCRFEYKGDMFIFFFKPGNKNSLFFFLGRVLNAQLNFNSCVYSIKKSIHKKSVHLSGTADGTSGGTINVGGLSTDSG
ncbi:hypothetical protein, partial [Klebsiella pneumoniae]|uniref:hypothetical protein n=1 Tax=Klebsiella pneumoniae TaxID=573 RepID=UPI0040557122